MDNQTIGIITLLRSALKDELGKLLFRDFARKNGDGSCDIPLILKKYGG